MQPILTLAWHHWARPPPIRTAASFSALFHVRHLPGQKGVGRGELEAQHLHTSKPHHGAGGAWAVAGKIPIARRMCVGGNRRLWPLGPTLARSTVKSSDPHVRIISLSRVQPLAIDCTGAGGPEGALPRGWGAPIAHALVPPALSAAGPAASPTVPAAAPVAAPAPVTAAAVSAAPAVAVSVPAAAGKGPEDQKGWRGGRARLPPPFPIARLQGAKRACTGIRVANTGPRHGRTCLGAGRSTRSQPRTSGKGS